MTTYKFKFNTGDRVYWEDYWPGKTEKHRFEGTIKKLPSSAWDSGYLIQFNKDFEDRYGRRALYQGFKDEHLTLVGPELTKEQKLSKKCMILWNTSKYIQNHPKQAYQI